METKKKGLHNELECSNLKSCNHSSACFFCIMKEQRQGKRHAKLAKLFKEMPSRSGEEQVHVMSGLWNIAMAHPNDSEFVELGILKSMADLVSKGMRDRRWLLRDQNVYIPYYAAHIIGSYCMNVEEFAKRAVEGGVILPLVELLRGRMTWVEQRVAVRALGHIASYDSTFSVVADDEIVDLCMELSCNCLDIVYSQFISCPGRRLRYHCDLLTRGIGSVEMENRKAEEWASQLQCWTLHVLNSFAYKEKFVPLICKPEFLKKLPGMWGGLVNENSPAGVGLLRILCYHKEGRVSISNCDGLVDSLCNIARSSDDWKYMAVDSLLLLFRDPHTRHKYRSIWGNESFNEVFHSIWFQIHQSVVIDKAVLALVDLAEMPSIGSMKGPGNMITDVLLKQCSYSRRFSPNTKRLLDELQNLRKRLKWEEYLSKEDLCVKKAAALVTKLEGNSRFSAGDLKGAVKTYTEALALCPFRTKKERMILYSNRAQCHLLLENPDMAISDTTRALSLSRPVGSHGKSLWRRAQAYDMKGLPKESLLDAIMFINECSTSDNNKPVKVPYYALEMVQKQMRAAWLFKDASERQKNLVSCKNSRYKLETTSSESLSSSETEESESESEWETVNEAGEYSDNEEVGNLKMPKASPKFTKRDEGCAANSFQRNQIQTSLSTKDVGVGNLTPVKHRKGSEEMIPGKMSNVLPPIKEEDISEEDKVQLKKRGKISKIVIMGNKRK